MPGLTKAEVDIIALQGTPPFGFLWGGAVLRPASGLTATAEAGIARIQTTGSRDFLEVALSTSSRAYTATRDTYVYLNNLGVLSFAEVTVGAARPTLVSLGAERGIFVALVTTDGSNVTSVIDLRPIAGASVDVIDFQASFVTASQGATDIPIPSNCRVLGLVGTVTTAVAATDAGTITAARVINNVATNIPGAVLTFAASSALGVRQLAVPTLATNPIIPSGQYLRLTTAKTTSGGTVAGYLLVEKL